MADTRLILAWSMALCLAVAGPFLPLLAAAAPDPGAVLLVVVPPWKDALAVVEAAGGRLIGPEQSWLGAFAASEAADFAARLRHAGAWTSLDGAVLAALCGLDS